MFTTNLNFFTYIAIILHLRFLLIFVPKVKVLNLYTLTIITNVYKIYKYAALCVPNVIFPGKQLRIYVYCILHIIFLPKSKKLTKKKIVKY